MLTNYLKMAWRNMVRNKAYSLINITGLSVSMTVVMMISLWIWDELSWNTCHKNYSRIAQVMRHAAFNGEIGTRSTMAVPLRTELGNVYADAFRHIVIATPADEHVLSLGDKKLLQQGRFMETGAPDMLSLDMLKGTRTGLNDPASILLSASLAKALFGDADPLNRVIKLDAGLDVKVTGVYQDLPANSEFSNLAFIAPWSLHAASNEWARKARDSWSIHSFDIFVQLLPGVDMDKMTSRIKDIERNHLGPDIAKVRNPQIFLHPMNRWHLYSEWKNGLSTGGRVQLVWLFGIIGIFVLLLACINFMNLSTAHAEKRAREVGIRKAVGSLRAQLIGQFFSESGLIAICAFAVSLLLASLTLPLFNEIAGKRIAMAWSNPAFWLLGAAACVCTALLAGLYPAFYLSSFRPAKVLRGAFRAGAAAFVPRKILVVAQFTISIVLIIGTLIVYRQIQYAKDRPVGYNRNGLLSVRMDAARIQKHYDALRTELLKTGVVVDMAASQGPATGVWDERSGFSWPGKDPDFQADFATIAVTHDYAKTVGLELLAGRDFSRTFSTDLSSGIILNEAAVKLMGLKDPAGQHSTITWAGEPLTVIGVVRDMIMTSPYEPVKQTVFYLNYANVNHIILRINPAVSAHKALGRIETVFRKYNPDVPFDYRFVDQEYAVKFAAEERVGKLAACFAGLAIFVSCLGLFGLATFVTRQRTKEIGIRKVLGASVSNLWLMVSKDFIVLVLIACLIATPVAYFPMRGWLSQFGYHTTISWWIFALAGLSALVIALLTVSYQSLKAAWVNPVNTLRSE